MKGTELMKGNWVSYLGVNKRVSQIGPDNQVRFFGKNKVIVSDDELEPILLTEEILEQNGFKKEGPAPQGVQVWSIIVNEKRFRLFEWVASQSFGLSDFPIKFVHEFQNTLQLLKVEKEIVLP